VLLYFLLKKVIFTVISLHAIRYYQTLIIAVVVVVTKYQLPDWFHKLEYYTTLIAHSNSAINPIIYTCFSASFRRGRPSVIITSLRHRPSLFTIMYGTLIFYH